MSQKKRSTFENIILECHRSEVENYLALFPVRPTRFSNLPGFNWPLFPVEIGYFLHKASFENLHKRVKNQSRFPVVRLHSNNDTWMCSCILSSWENGIPLNMIIILRGRLFNPARGKHVLKRAENHRCEVNILEICW